MPASWPNSIKSFTTKVNNVDDSDAAHVNDLQNEVTAIETSLGVGKVGDIVQVKYAELTAKLVCSTTCPMDTSVPQTSELTLVTSVAITPKSTSHSLIIEGFVSGQTPSAQPVIIGVSKDAATSMSKAAVGSYPSTNESFNAFIKFKLAIASTSSQTYKLYAGGNTGTIYVNGKYDNTELFTGAVVSSLTIYEVKM